MVIEISHTMVKCRFGPRYVRTVRRVKAGRLAMRWVGHLDCEPRGPIHSTDRIRVHRGRAPERWCGFHAAMI